MGSPCTFSRQPGNDAELLLGALARLLLAALLLLVGLLLAALMLLVGLLTATLLLLARFVRLLAGILIGIVRIGHKHLLEGLPRPTGKRLEMKRVRARNDQLGDTFPRFGHELHGTRAMEQAIK
jgi:hypothetical protein